MKLEELKALLLKTDPAVVLVRPRELRGIIQREFKVPYLLVNVPHEKCHVFDRQVLFREVEQDKLGLEPDRRLPETVILIARPTPEELEGDREALLLRYWRLLFHARIDQSLLQQVQSGALNPKAIRSRIEAIGQTEFEEIRGVLTDEHFLPNPDDDTRVYIEFAALYLDLRYFASNLRNSYFPSLRNFAAIDALLAQDVEAETLFRQTRLPGAADPVMRTDTSSDESNDFYHRLLATAKSYADKGDTIRAAIIHTKAARVAPAALTERTRRLALADLEKLTQRLKEALPLTDEAAADWLEVLPSLLDKADQGEWTQEARLLYDLQNVCIEHEKQTFALDLVEWVISAGHRPIQRPLYGLQVVRMTKHLRSAAQRLTMARISDEDRRQLSHLLQASVALREEKLRERFRPILNDALYDVGLQPKNNPEKVAKLKLIEELLDRITNVGFFTFADLRDAIARNQLKMADLSDPYAFWRGDALLRLDRRLSTAMDGVYRRGEFYMRLLERLSSLLFGTGAGRFLTVNLILPFGGAFVLLAMLDKLVLPLFGVEVPTAHAVTAAAEGAPAETPHSLARSLLHYRLHWGTLALGVFFLALTHSAPLRAGLRTGLFQFYRLLRFILFEGPRRVYRLPVVQEVLRSWSFLLFNWYVLKPLIICGIVWWLWPVAFFDWRWAILTYVVVLAALHSKYGTMLSEAFGELFALIYGWLRFDLLQGLYRFTLYVFRKISDAFETLLYTVDEWLRFSSGESRWRMAARAFLGLLWFPFGYLIRFYFVTMVEPSINPLKLPLSSLAAKFMYPLYLGLLTPFSEQQKELMSEVDHVLGYSLAVAVMMVIVWPTLYLLPSVFAFFVWEMKGNWRSFAANRPMKLETVVVEQQHGETLPMLLRPGFHSGSIPKLFTNLRQAERQAYRTNQWRPARTYRKALQEIAAAVAVFVEREFITLLKQRPTWQHTPLSVGPIHLAGNRIAVTVLHGDYEGRPLRIGFDERSGWLLAGILENGWLAEVDEAARAHVVLGLAGLYKLAGANLIREQLQHLFDPKEPAYDVTDDGLTLWPEARGGERVVYDLYSIRGELRPYVPPSLASGDWPRLPVDRVRYGKHPILWQDWVACWDQPTDEEVKEINRVLGDWHFYRAARGSLTLTAARNGTTNGHARGPLTPPAQKPTQVGERHVFE